MRLYLIRHAESTNNALSSISHEAYQTRRSHDPELTDIGRQQAQLVADYIAECTQTADDTTLEPFGITHLYVSPMKRTLDTAQPIAKALNLQPEVWVAIHEIGGLFLAEQDDAGEETVTGYPGLTRSEIAQMYPDYLLPETITERGWWDAASGRETPEQFVARALTVAMALRRRIRTDDRIALVAHGAFLDSLLKAIYNQSPSHPDDLYYGHFNTGITRIDFENWDGNAADRLYVRYQNKVAHLPSDLITR